MLETVYVVNVTEPEHLSNQERADRLVEASADLDTAAPQCNGLSVPARDMGFGCVPDVVTDWRAPRRSRRARSVLCRNSGVSGRTAAPPGRRPNPRRFGKSMDGPSSCTGPGDEILSPGGTGDRLACPWVQHEGSSTHSGDRATDRGVSQIQGNGYAWNSKQRRADGPCRPSGPARCYTPRGNLGPNNPLGVHPAGVRQGSTSAPQERQAD